MSKIPGLQPPSALLLPKAGEPQISYNTMSQLNKCKFNAYQKPYSYSNYFIVLLHRISRDLIFKSRKFEKCERDYHLMVNAFTLETTPNLTIFILVATCLPSEVKSEDKIKRV